MDKKKRIKIFCCYAREDQSLLIELKKQLKLWERESLITIWTDTDITPGTSWEEEVIRHLNAAHIILFLVSPDFLASDYCYSTEMKYAMERYKRGDASVIPIILRHCVWQEAPFGKIEALPANAEPVVGAGWYNRDEAFANVVQGIRKVIEEWKEQQQVQEISPTHKTWKPQVKEKGDLSLSDAHSSRGEEGPKYPQSPTRPIPFVTNREYLRFVQSAGLRRPPRWNPTDPGFPDDQDDAPVTGVSWVDAVAYCDWTGGCLPGMDGEGSPIEDIPEIGEWRDAGDEWQKQVCDPHTLRLIEVVNRETPRQNVGFRCAPVRPISLMKWTFIEGGPCRLGTDVTKFRHLADIHHLPFALRQPILRRL